MRQFLRATATLCGLIIGVGIFGVPFVTARSGLGVGLFWLAVVGVVVLTVHLLYGEVVAATPGKHRLPGYIGRVFGSVGKQVVIVLDVVRFWGLQLAYLIVGGNFLFLLLGQVLGGNPLVYSLGLFGIVALVTFFGLRVVGRLEWYLTWVLLAAFVVVIGKGIPHIAWGNLFVPGTGGWFSPYGAIMVALSGAPAIPEIWDLARHRRNIFRWSIIVGTLLPLILTALFTVVVVGVSGGATSPEAIAGLAGALGSGVVYVGALAGFLAIITSYLVIALYLQEALRYDFLVKRAPAWVLAVSVPLLLFLAGAQDFIAVMDIIGSILFGLEGVLIVTVALVIIRRRRLGAPRLKTVWGILVALLLALGVIQKLAHWV